MATLTPLPTIPSAASGDITRSALSRQDLFDGIPRRDLDLLDARLPVVRWPRDGVTPPALTRGDHIYLVRQGRVALSDGCQSGPEVMTTIVESGAVYSTLGQESTPPSAALEMSAVTPLPLHAVEALITRYPRFGVNLAIALSQRLVGLRQTVGIVAEMRVEDRLRRRLHQIAEQIGTAAPEGVRIGMDLTHAQWALLIGASREAVTTAFGKLRGTGEVVMDGRSITIPWAAMRADDCPTALAPCRATGHYPHGCQHQGHRGRAHLHRVAAPHVASAASRRWRSCCWASW